MSLAPEHFGPHSASDNAANARSSDRPIPRARRRTLGGSAGSRSNGGYRVVVAEELGDAVRSLQSFALPGDLTARIAGLEWELAGKERSAAVSTLADERVTSAMLAGAVAVKRVAGEINVAIHALGILLALPHVLEPHERIESLSLGAGNTGRSFDLETDRQVAEFKFIAWRGGAEAIRQNGLFIDIFRLALAETDRRKVVYLTGLDHPLRFLRGRRALGSVLSKSSSAAARFHEAYGDRYAVVADYWRDVSATVELVDLLPLLPVLGGLPPEDSASPSTVS